MYPLAPLAPLRPRLKAVRASRVVRFAGNTRFRMVMEMVGGQVRGRVHGEAWFHSEPHIESGVQVSANETRVVHDRDARTVFESESNIACDLENAKFEAAVVPHRSRGSPKLHTNHCGAQSVARNL